MASETVKTAFETGRGPVTVRGKAFIEEPDQPAKKGSKAAKGTAAGPGRPLIVITQLPYQTNKSSFVADLAEMVEKGKLTGALLGSSRLQHDC